MKPVAATALSRAAVETDGDFERCEREWLHTNGAGAYSMSTLALMHTRREHGLLVASLDPPNKRVVVLSHAETTLTVGNKRHRLSTHRFPGVAPTPGYRSLLRFDQDPIPRWTYRLGKHILQRQLCLVRHKNALVVRYDWFGKNSVQLSLTPLLSMRPTGELMHEHGAMVQRVTLRTGAVEVQPVRDLPPVHFTHDGIFMGSPDWWRRFEYTEDRAQDRAFEEDLWTPGTFELRLEPGKPCFLVTALGEMPRAQPAALMQETIDALAKADPGPEYAPLVRIACVGAQEYVATGSRNETFLVAGYPDLGASTRDHLLAVPAFCLFEHSASIAWQLLATCCRRQRAGLLPLNLKHADRTHPSPDATLWLFEAARAFVEREGPEHVFVQEVLLPALVRAYLRLRRPSGPWVWTSPEGLLTTVSADGFPLSWMDAYSAGKPVTARAGVAVEHQALWVRGTAFLSELSGTLGHDQVAREAADSSRAARVSFQDRFWCNETDYPFDCISSVGDTAAAWADATIRPNALIALSVAPECFESWQSLAILERVEQFLLTPRGLRTLAPSDERYQPVFEGGPDARSGALHQGTAWTHLLGTYARTAAREDAVDESRLWDLLDAALSDGQVLGHLGQIADGEAPHRLRGCPAQAWSQTELLRALMRLELSLEGGQTSPDEGP